MPSTQEPSPGHPLGWARYPPGTLHGGLSMQDLTSSHNSKLLEGKCVSLFSISTT